MGNTLSNTPQAIQTARPTSPNQQLDLTRTTGIAFRKGQTGASVDVTLPFIPPKIGQARLPLGNGQGALPARTDPTPIGDDRALEIGQELGVNTSDVKKLNAMITSTYALTVASDGVRKAEELQAPGETSDRLERTLNELRPGESIEFNRNVSLTAAVSFFGIPGGLPGLSGAAEKAPGTDTAWLSPSMNYNQANSVTISRNAGNETQVTVSRGHDASAATEVGIFPFWADDSFSKPADSSAYGFFYGGIRPGLGATHETSITFTIDPGQENETGVVKDFVSGKMSLSTLVGVTKRIEASTNSPDMEISAPAPDGLAISQTRETTPLRLSAGINIGGGLGIASPRTVVPQKYALDIWVWPNIDATASIDIAKQIETTADTVAAPERSTQYLSKMDASASANAMLALGHHVPKPDKEQFADDFWILQYPVTLSAGKEAQVPVRVHATAQNPESDAPAVAFEAPLLQGAEAQLVEHLTQAGIDRKNAELLLPELSDEANSATLTYRLADHQAQPQELDFNSYRLSKISVVEKLVSEAAPMTLNPLNTNFDFTFLAKEDLGQVITSRLAATIEVEPGQLTIKRPGGFEEVIANPSSEAEQIETGLRRRRSDVP